VVSGLKVNMAKSVLVPMGNVDNVVELAGLLGSETSSLPLKYLGLPLGAHLRPSPLGMALWRRLSVVWLVGKECICPRMERLPSLKALFSSSFSSLF
jgi:hypothetical protein